MMVITVPPRKRNQPGNKFLLLRVKFITTLIQDTLCVRENVRLYNCVGLVTNVYFVSFETT